MKKTVTIGIPAYNEAKNIKHLLDSIMNQAQETCTLEAVVVMCDGCTDSTAEIVREYTEMYSFVIAIDDGKRYGRSKRINQLIDLNKSDFLIVMDADTTFGTKKSLDAFVPEFSDPKVGLVAGADMPCAPHTFFESIVVTGVALWRSVRLNYNHGDTVHNSHGCILAISREFSEKLHVQENVNGADHFFYFKAKELGFEFRYAKDAIVYYREPSNVSDYIVQRRRFYTIGSSMIEIFGDWVIPYYRSTPLSLRIKKIIAMFFKHPILLPLAIGLQLGTNVYMKIKKPEQTRAIWNTIQSTK